LLSCASGISIHEATELVGERDHIRDPGFEVEVETIDSGRSKWAVDSRPGCLWAKDGPDVVRSVDSGYGVREAAFGISGSTYGKENGFAIRALACGYVLSWKLLSA